MSMPAAAELARADARLQAGQASEAVAILEGAAVRHPTAIEVHGRLGIALCLVGRLADACGAFEAALRLDSGFIEARVNLGMTRLHLGDRSAGLRFIREAIALKPDHADSWQLAASAAYAEGHARVAAAAAGRALALVRAHGTALGVQALALRRLGKYGASFRAARRAVRASTARHQPAATVRRVTAILPRGAAGLRNARLSRRHARAEIEQHVLEQLFLRGHRIETHAVRTRARALRARGTGRTPRTLAGDARARALSVGGAGARADARPLVRRAVTGLRGDGAAPR